MKFISLTLILLLTTFIFISPINAGTTTYYPDQGSAIWSPDNPETGDQDFSIWGKGDEYDVSNAPRAIIVPEYKAQPYFEYSAPTQQYFDYQTTQQWYTPTYNDGCSNCDSSYKVDSYNFQPSYGSGVEYQDSTYVSCFPNKYKAEKGQSITWTVVVNSSSSTTYEWEGSGVDGKKTSKATTSYSTTGEKTAHVNVTSNGNSTRYNCGSVYVEEPPLYISCYPNNTYIEEGSSIKWKADISGGDGSYDLEWRGHKEIKGKSNDEVNIKYKDSGSYSADLEVRSGSQSRTVYCGNVSVSGSYISPLYASCNANKSYANPGEVVEWKVNVTGGKGNYDYEWRGSDPVDGKKEKIVRVEYNSLGKKFAEVEVCSSSDCMDIQCGGVTISDKPEGGTFTYTPAYSGLEGSCVANKTDISVGEQVIWQATVNQPVSSSLFIWNGTDGLNELRGDRQSVAYKTPGVKEGSFSVRTESGELFSFTCPNTINVRPLEAGSGLLSLGQVPYTGPGDVLKLVGLIALLMIWSGVTVVIIRRRIGRRKVTNIIENFKQENMNN